MSYDSIERRTVRSATTQALGEKARGISREVDRVRKGYMMTDNRNI